MEERKEEVGEEEEEGGEVKVWTEGEGKLSGMGLGVNRFLG